MTESSGGVANEYDDSDASQLIRQAILFENLDLLADLLMEHPWAMEKVDRHGRTPLMLAAQNGRANSLRVLLEASPETLDLANIRGKTALHMAAEAGQLAAVEHLLTAGADAVRVDCEGHCALEMSQMAAHNQVSDLLIQTIQKKNEDMNAAHDRLIAACIEGDSDSVQNLLETHTEKKIVREVLFNGRSPDDATALLTACAHGRADIVRQLTVFNEHVIVNPTTSDTVIHASVSSQNCEVLQIVLEKFPHLVATTNCEGSTCLHWAARCGSSEAVKTILNFPFDDKYVNEVYTVGAPAYRLAIDVNEGDEECRTAMYLAVAEGYTEVVQAMLQFKCMSVDGVLRCPFQPDVYCVRGRTPLMLAAFNQSLPMLNLLLDAGADINLPLAVLDSEVGVEEGRCIGSGALVEAVRADAVHIIHFLFDKGALDTDNKGLRLAAETNNEKIVRIFLTRLVFHDPEYKINKKNIDVGQIQLGQNLLPSSLCPSRAAQLNWSSSNLSLVQSEWFVAAALHVNPRLRTTRLALAAITRVDLSSNRIRIFPSVLFQMPSLRNLNLADNQIKSIEVPSYYISSTSLEILNLRDNQIESISAQFLSSFPLLQQLDLSKNKLSNLPEFIWLCPSLKDFNVSHNRLSSLPTVAQRMPRTERPRLPNATEIIATQESSLVEDNPLLKTNPLRRNNIWQNEINLSKTDDDSLFSDFPVTSSNTLTTINLSHNKFHTFPQCLACTCPRLLILNMSHNFITAFPPISCVPAHIRNLDLSHNMIRESFSRSSFGDICYAVAPSTTPGGVIPKRRNSPARQNRTRSKSAVRSQRSLSVSRHRGVETNGEENCIHKRHESLEWCKTLTLAGNKLSAIVVITSHGKLIYPALNVLDVSNNMLKTITTDISKFGLLSVLNLSENIDLKELPPDFGMLSKLWSLSLKGCSLKEPLHTMVNVDNCKTVEIVAYLKTILEESKKYRHLRLVILGGDCTGKTTIWEGLRNEAVQKGQPTVSESGAVKISHWKFEAKRSKGEPARGPVGISAWDFGGQREYHSTHQYFISKRALYLVVWKVTDADESLSQLDTLLINIQARAPNAAVILVGTHVDNVSGNVNKFPVDFITAREQEIRMRYMIADADKSGLPRVVDVHLITAKNKSDIKSLLNSIYKASWEVRIGKERALDQEVPSSYVAMIMVSREIATDFRKDHQPAVMTKEAYKARVKKAVVSKLGRSLRDDIEFHGACTFLHDCGEIVRFEDSTLRDLIFVDPLWLVELLTSIVALRSPSLPAGLLSLEAMNPITRSYKTRSSLLLKSQLLDLLHKYELALLSSPRQLLLPGLLPDEYQLRADFLSSAIRINSHISSWSIRSLQKQIPVSHEKLSISRFKHILDATSATENDSDNELMLTFAYNDEDVLRRLYVLAYVPSGFWGRLINRIVGDKNIVRAIESLFVASSRADVIRLKEACTQQIKPEWVVWQTGLELHVKGHALFVLKAFQPQAEIRDVDYSTVDLRVKDEQKRWNTWNARSSRKPFVEMIIYSLRIHADSNKAKLSMNTDIEGRSRLLALVVDVIDTLLEDWYPALGTRFVHSSEGELLVSRAVACPQCANIAQKATSSIHRHSQDDIDLSSTQRDKTRMRSSKTTGDVAMKSIVYLFSAEECMLAGRELGFLECPAHGRIHMRDCAPDTVFMDIEHSLTIPNDQIRRGRMLGRGAFGFVFRATYKLQSGELCEVAQKMLEPVDPGPGGRPSAIAAYKAAADKWRRDSLEFACRAYCTSRQELTLLSRLSHTNIISFIGVCTSPLSLIVELAPLGALNQLLASHRKSGSKLSLGVIKDSAVQIARALEYLHSVHVIYRDLKSENVLGWRFPAPFSTQADVLLKLGDYGISRSVLPSGGAKGFGGTEGFMAPEIIRFNGEEEYTPKVDCFSFGMFLYELLTLKMPFEGEEHVKEQLLEGARPVLSTHELLFPSPMLDLMALCWSAHADARPSSSQLVGYCAAPEFSHLLDVCEWNEALPPSSLLVIAYTDELNDPDDFDAQIWMTGRELSVIGCTQYGFIDNKSLELSTRLQFICKIRDSVWLCDNSGQVSTFSFSIHETGSLQLPTMSGPLVREPELFGFDLLLLVSEKQIMLLRFNENNSVHILGSVDSPYEIRNAVVLENGSSKQIWTGHDEGRISIHHLASNDTFSFSSLFYLADSTALVRQMVTSNDASRVWIVAEQDSRVQCIDVEKRNAIASFDIRKIMPGSETIHTIDMEMASENVITSICLRESSSGGELYIATSKGLVVVTNAQTLQPLNAFRPFEGEITSIFIVEESNRDDDRDSIRGRTALSTSSSESGLGWMRERVSETVERFRMSPATTEMQSSALLVTIGRQFRSLSHRFVCESELPDVYSIAIWRTNDWTF